MDRIIPIKKYYSSLPNMQAKYEKRCRQDAFTGETLAEWQEWKRQSIKLLKKLIGWDKMETCPLNPIVEEVVALEGNIVREKVIIQTEPDVWMPMYILIPEGATECFLALPGHLGAGKFSVAGCYDIPAVMDSIERFHYDYGMKLAKLGYVAVCPDCRGFGERRDAKMQLDTEQAFMTSSCFQLAHMAEGLGETVAGMCTWDVVRLIDYLEERGQWNLENLGCVGFSGGGLQTLWASVMDERIKRSVISGYLYGYRDAFLILNSNCSCNYVPGLWEHYDMGDVASLIAPRPLIIQSCREDHLNGPRGLVNVMEQMDIVRNAYRLFHAEDLIKHDLRDGDHCFHQEVLEENL